VKRVTDIRQVELIGGGGTDMMAGIHQAERLSPRPDIIIVVTDGDTDWGRKPAIPVIVALTDGDRNVPGWARKVVIND
jgi:predicted metal-dependent peptidase